MQVVDLFWLLFFHTVGDFVFQNDWMLKNKTKSLYILIAHSIVWAGVIAFGFFLMWGIELASKPLIFLFLGHLVMDSLNHPLVPRYKKGLCFDFDYLFHITQLLIVYFWSK